MLVAEQEGLDLDGVSKVNLGVGVNSLFVSSHFGDSYSSKSFLSGIQLEYVSSGSGAAVVGDNYNFEGVGGSRGYSTDTNASSFAADGGGGSDDGIGLDRSLGGEHDADLVESVATLAGESKNGHVNISHVEGLGVAHVSVKGLLVGGIDALLGGYEFLSPIEHEVVI